MASLYIADSSVFIDFFRGKSSPRFEELLLSNQIVLSSFVKLELLIGVRKTEAAKLEYLLGGLIPLNETREVFDVAVGILATLRPKGLTVGTIDLLIAAQAKMTGLPVLSSDRVFSRLADLRIIKR